MGNGTAVFVWHFSFRVRRSELFKCQKLDGMRRNFQLFRILPVVKGALSGSQRLLFLFLFSLFREAASVREKRKHPLALRIGCAQNVLKIKLSKFSCDTFPVPFILDRKLSKLFVELKEVPSFSCLLAWLKRAIFKHCFVQNVLQLALYFEVIKSRAGEAQRFLQNRISVSLALAQTEAQPCY